MLITHCLLPPKSLLARRYQILRQLGQGGFATVYLARDRHERNRMVALKQIHLETLSLQEMLDASDAYNREVNHLSQLRYKHLPRIYDHFMDEHHWYIVIEYIEGMTLEEYLKTTRHGYLPPMQVLNIGIALCDTLQYLHMQRPPLIFRDVKPSNIILTRAGKPYLIDFGTARPYRPGWKDTGPLGTPGYAAPEQYGKRAHTTPQTDIYGLGATLQTLLTGKDPLEIQQHGIPPTRAWRIPQKLQDELAHMQIREATSRPRNMAEVKQALQSIKAQFLSQKIKTASATFWETFKETSTLMCMSLLLLAFVDFASFTDMTWQSLWTVSLLVIAGFTSLSSIFKLREARDESQDRLPAGEKFAIIWRQLTLSLPLSLLISMVTYYFFSLINLLGAPPDGENVVADLLTSGIIVGGAILTVLGWIIRRIFIIRAMRKRAASQPRPQILIQQTVRPTLDQPSQPIRPLL
jgi:serine/threonine protein kinase